MQTKLLRREDRGKILPFRGVSAVAKSFAFGTSQPVAHSSISDIQKRIQQRDFIEKQIGPLETQPEPPTITPEQNDYLNGSAGLKRTI